MTQNIAPGHVVPDDEDMEVLQKLATHSKVIATLVDELEWKGADPRWLAIGKTHLQEGFMALRRAVMKPDHF